MSFKNSVRNDYFEWLYDYVCKGRAHHNVSYKRLFEYLYEVEFIYLIPNDINRASDGINLRYRFAMIYDDESISNALDGPCSILEMLVALAIRCEEFMDDTRYGDRTGQWFWSMLFNLGIDGMTDDIFDIEYVEERIYTFLDREYEPDGRGGLFYIRNCDEDLRNVEIWTQLCWYLNTFV